MSPNEKRRAWRLAFQCGGHSSKWFEDYKLQTDHCDRSKCNGCSNKLLSDSLDLTSNHFFPTADALRDAIAVCHHCSVVVWVEVYIAMGMADYVDSNCTVWWRRNRLTFADVTTIAFVNRALIVPTDLSCSRHDTFPFLGFKSLGANNWPTLPRFKCHINTIGLNLKLIEAKYICCGGGKKLEPTA